MKSARLYVFQNPIFLHFIFQLVVVGIVDALHENLAIVNAVDHCPAKQLMDAANVRVTL